MAFQSGAGPVQCQECGHPGKFFRMFQSFRDEHVWYREGEPNRPMASLFCIDCEVKHREDEWIVFSAEEKKCVGEDYPTMKAVKRDQKER